MSEEIKKEEVKAENAESTQDAETAQECTAEGDNEKSEKPDRKEKKLSKKLEAELAELKAQNEQLQKALDEEKDRALRIAAEYDNFRRRSKAEREGVYSDAYADAVNQILPIIDNLERAEGFDSAEEVKKGESVTDIYCFLVISSTSGIYFFFSSCFSKLIEIVSVGS